jgi:hypothetical protein
MSMALAALEQASTTPVEVTIPSNPEVARTSA